MRIRRSPIDETEFDSTAEQTGDADLSRRLTRFVASVDGGATIVLDGGWGVGKTTFIRRWLAGLRSQDIPAIYLDAFAVDYLEDPFIAVAGTISEATAALRGKASGRYENFVAAASKVGTTIALSAAKIGIRAATVGLIDMADIQAITNASEAGSDTLSADIESWIKSRIEEHDARKKEIDFLRAALDQLATELAKGSPSKSLIVVIDDLDRCRPDFALGILENIKHFFGVKSVVFLLVCNTNQLRAAINHRYGSGLSSEEYLRKFYDLRVDYALDYSERYGSKVVAVIAQINNEVIHNREQARYVEEYVRDIARAYKLSLRDIEQIYAIIAVAYATEHTLYRPPVLVAFLAALKLLQPTLFSLAKTSELTLEEARSFISNRQWRDFDVERLDRILQYHLDPNLNEEEPEWRSYGQDMWKYGIGRLETLKFISNSIIDRFDVP